MATLVLGYAAQIVATSFGFGFIASFALSIGATYLGSAIDRMLFGTTQRVQGPRLSDLSVQTSTEGASLPIVFGTMRLAGNVIWSTGLTEIATTEEQGGGSGGGGSSYTTYSYTTDCAVAICEGTITGIRRIWADTKLIYDVSETATVGTLVASSSYAAGIRIYDGSETQLTDPLIEAVEGVAPAYRGTAYIVFEDLQLGDFGNRLPNFTFEVVKSGSIGLTYSEYRLLSSNNTSLVIPSSVSATYNTINHYIWSGGLYGYSGSRTSLLTYSRTHVLTGVEEVLFSGNIGLPTGTVSPSENPWQVPAAGGLLSTGIYLSSSLASYAAERPRTSSEDMHVVVRNFYAQYTGSIWVAGFMIYYTDTPNSFPTTPTMLAFTQITSPGSFGGAIGFKSKDIFVFCADRHSAPRLYYNGVTITLQVDAIDYGLSLIKFFNDRFVIGVNPAASGYTKLYWFTYEGTLIESLISSKISVSKRCGPSNDNYVYIAHNESGTTKIGPLTSSSIADNYVDLPASFGAGLARYDSYTEATLSYNNTLFHHINQYHTSLYLYYNRYVIYKDTISKTTQNLQTICEQIVAESLLDPTQYDFSALSDIEVRGYTITKQSRSRDAIEPLMSTYMFDLVEEDNKLVAKKASSTLSKTLNQNELGTYQI